MRDTQHDHLQKRGFWKTENPTNLKVASCVVSEQPPFSDEKKPWVWQMFDHVWTYLIGWRSWSWKFQLSFGIRWNYMKELFGVLSHIYFHHLLLGILTRSPFFTLSLAFCFVYRLKKFGLGHLARIFLGFRGGGFVFWIFAKSLHLDQRGQLMYSPGNYLGRKAGKSSTPKGRKCREYVIIPSREKIFTMKDTISCLKLPVWFQSRKCLVKKRNPMVTWWFQSRHNWVYPYGTRTTWYVLCSLGILGEYLYTLYICKP